MSPPRSMSKRPTLAATVAVVVAVALLEGVSAMCPNLCNANGLCNANNLCTCFPGYTGPECNQRTCDYGYAWADKAYAVDSGHQLSECSSAGLCNRGTGVCECYDGFTGQACEKAACPNDCYERGECMTMEDMALTYGQDYDPSVISYGDGYGPSYTNWDKGAGTLCNCNAGYFGPDCSQAMCPKGDDPMTDNQNYRQILLTVQDYAPFSGVLGVSFQGETTFISLASPTSSDCETSFEASEKFDDITCVYSANDDGDELYFDITFVSWPRLPEENNLYSHSGNPSTSDFTCDITRTDPNTVCIFSDVVTTQLREYEYCSNRGTCNFKTGVCSCDDGFGGLACERIENVFTHTTDTGVAEQVTARSPDFVSTAYLISAARSSHPDYYLLESFSDSKQSFYIRGDGEVGALKARVWGTGLTVEQGGLTVEFGGLNVPTDGAYFYQTDVTSPSLSVHSTSETFTGDALKISTVATKTTAHNLVNAYSFDTSVFSIRGDGLMSVSGGILASGGISVMNRGLILSDGITIHSGGMKVTGGITIEGASTITGGVTINSAGLQVDGGMTSHDSRVVVETGGVLITAGGQTVSAGGMAVVDGITVALNGMTITGSLSVHSSGVKVTGGMTVSDLGLTITNGLTVETAGVTVESGGMSIYDGATVTGGLTVHNTGVRVLGGTTVVDTGLTVELGGMSIDSWGLFVTDGLTVITGGLMVNVGGAGIVGGVSIQDTGMKVTSGLTVNSGGVTGTLGGATIAAGGVKVTGGLTVETSRLHVEASGIIASGGLTVYDTGLKVSNGITIPTLGLVVAGGGGTIRAGSMKVANGLSVTTGGVVIEADGLSSTGGLTVQSAGATINGGITVMNSGLIVTANGASIAGNGLKVESGVSVMDTGITVTVTGMKVTGGITLRDTGLKVTGGVTVDSGGLFVSATGGTIVGGLNTDGGLTLLSGALKVDTGGIKSTGGLSINDNGLTVPSGMGITVVDTGLVVADTGMTISANGLDAEGISVPSGGLNVDASGIRVTGGLTVGSLGVSLAAGASMSVKDGGLEVVAGGFSVTGGMKVASGLTVESGNVIVSSHVRSSGGLSVYAGGGITSGLTVRDTGLKVDSGGATFTGHVYVSGTMTVSGDIYCNTNTPSDRRLKTNISPLKNSLSEVTKLRGVYFTWSEKSPAFNTSQTAEGTKRQLGLIAQDVKSVYPELVHDIMNGEYLGVNYVSLVPVLIEAVRELNDKYVDLDMFSRDLDISTQHC